MAEESQHNDSTDAKTQKKIQKLVTALEEQAVWAQLTASLLSGTKLHIGQDGESRRGGCFTRRTVSILQGTIGQRTQAD